MEGFIRFIVGFQAPKAGVHSRLTVNSIFSTKSRFGGVSPPRVMPAINIP